MPARYATSPFAWGFDLSNEPAYPSKRRATPFRAVQPAARYEPHRNEEDVFESGEPPEQAPSEPARAVHDLPASETVRPETSNARDSVPEERAKLREALADLEAAKARVQRDAERVKNETRDRLVADLFPILDNLDRSIAAAQQGGEAQALLQGIQLVREQFASVLEGYGVQRVQSLGEPFDPSVHEAVGVIEVDDPHKHGRVMDEWQAGYRAGDRLLRAAKVRVGKLAA